MENKPPCSFIWEPSDDPLIVRIDEEALCIECAQFTSKMQSLSNVIKRTTEAAQEQDPEPRAAQAYINISKDRMAAWIYVIPPFNGGQDIKEEDLKSILNQEHVSTGIIEESLKSIVENQVYGQAVLIAKGILARDGIDGSIKDHFKRDLKLEFIEDENGSVDYKKN
uniref:flagellar assembly protein A n=1 Tax=Clostridium sp. NkU-1 TaxID=1095009 RepID=UPI000AEA13E2